MKAGSVQRLRLGYWMDKTWDEAAKAFADCFLLNCRIDQETLRGIFAVSVWAA